MIEEGIDWTNVWHKPGGMPYTDERGDLLYIDGALGSDVFKFDVDPAGNCLGVHTKEANKFEFNFEPDGTLTQIRIPGVDNTEDLQIKHWFETGKLDEQKKYD